MLKIIGLLFAIFLLPAWTHGSSAIPQQSALIEQWSADDLVLSNGDPVSSWTGRINGTVCSQATAGSRPVYQTNQFGTKPGVTFNSKFCTVSSPGIVGTTLDTKIYTLIVYFKINGTVSTRDCIVCAVTADTPSTINLHFFYQGSNSLYGVYSIFGIAGTPSSLTTLGIASNNNFSGGEVATYTQLSVNGAISGSFSDTVGLGAETLSFGSNAANTLPCNCTIAGMALWNVMLSPADHIRFQRYVSDSYAQPYPWAGLTKYFVAHGDSITKGTGNNATTGGVTPMTGTYPGAMAATLGLLPGQWMNLGIGGITYDSHGGQNGMIQYVTPWLAELPGVLQMCVGLLAFEWHNQYLVSLSGATVYAKANTYITAVGAISNMQLVFGTNSDTSNATENTERGVFNGLMDVSAPGNTNIKAYVKIHNDTTGVGDGSWATFAPAGNPPAAHFSDGVHPNSAIGTGGYSFLATDMLAGWNALPSCP